LSSIIWPEAHVKSEGTSGLFEALSLNPYRNCQFAHLIKTLFRRKKWCIFELRKQSVPTVRAAGKVARLERAFKPTRFKRQLVVGRNYLGDVNVDGQIFLKLTPKKEGVRLCGGFNWPNTELSGEALYAP